MTFIIVDKDAYFKNVNVFIFTRFDETLLTRGNIWILPY